MIAELEHRAFPEIVIEQLIAAAVAPIDGEDQLGFSVIVIVTGVDEPHPGVEKATLPLGIDDEPLIDKRQIQRAVAKIGLQLQLCQRGVQSLELNAYAFNEAAARLYEAAGFVTVFRRLGRDI
jgi:hypothetical protein